MSRGSRVHAIAITMITVIAPAAGDAQNVPDRSDRERDLIDAIEALAPQVQQARERAGEMDAMLDSMRFSRDAARASSFPLGPFRVYADAERVDEARRFFQAAWAEFDPWVGDSVSVRRPVFIYQRRPGGGPTEVTRDPSTLVVAWAYRGEGSTLRAIRSRIGRELGQATHPRVREWIQNTSVLGTMGEGEQRRMRRELLLAPSMATQACVRGQIGGCTAAFGLGGSVDPMGEWYQGAQVRLLSTRRFDGEQVCDPAIEVQGCQAWLSLGNHWTRAIPLSGPTRGSLLGLALSRGGAGAIERFLSNWPDWEAAGSNVPYAEVAAAIALHLEAASGAPLEVLLEDWRVRVLYPSEETGRAERRAGAGTLFWILFFALFSMRSTRWRLG